MPFFLVLIVSFFSLCLPNISTLASAAPASNNQPFKFVKGDAATGLKEYRFKPNGLTVLLQEKHSSPVLTVMVMYKVGSRNEAVGYTGATHFLEHMMFKGTAKHDPLKGTGLDDILKPMGGVNNASTSYDRTDYYEVVPASGLEACLDLEADRMRHALLRNSDRQSEMTVVRNELERDENTAINILDMQVFATAFREHPYHHPTIGWRSDVEGVPIERLRKFYNDFYYPNNATLTIIGDFKTAETLALINKYFSSIAASAKPFPAVYTVEPPQEGERRFEVLRGNEMPKLMLAYHIPNAVHEDAYPLEVLAALLGDESKQSSRLYKKMVDSGLASQAGAANLSLKDPGLFILSATANSGTKLKTLEKKFDEVLEQLTKEPVAEFELERAKKGVWKKLKLEADDPAEFAQQLSDAQAVADWTWIVNVEKKIKSVTAQQVQEVARKYFSSTNRTVGHYLPKVNEPESLEKKTAAPANQAQISEPGAVVQSKSANADLDRASGERLEAGGGFAATAYREIAKPESKQVAAAPKGLKGMISTRTKVKVLGNGMTVYVLPIHGNGIVAVSAKIKGCGESNAPEEKTLLPGLVCDMLNKGSKNATKEKLADTLEMMGTSIAPSVEPFWADVETEVVREDLDQLFSVLSDSLHNPLFAASELEKLKRQHETELKDLKVETAELAENKLLGLIYKPGCVYFQRPFDEQISELSKITVDDLRDFHKKHYLANNVILAIAGDLSAEEGFQLAEKHFGAWEKGGAVELSTENCGCHGQFAFKQIVSRLPDKSSVDIMMAYPADVSIKSKDFCAAQLANAALGHDTLSSRLGQVREKYGLSYDISSMFSDNAEPWSPWVVQLSVNPENTGRAIKLVNNIVADYVKRGITASELAVEKKRIAGEYLVYRMRTPRHLADALTKYGALGLGPQFMDNYPSMLSAVTLQQANAAIRKYMQPSRLVTSLAGSVPADIKNR